MTKQFNLLLFFLFFSCLAYSQVGTGGNLGGGVDDEPLHFGFTFQYVTSEYKILKRADWQSPRTKQSGQPMDSLYAISSPLSPGFGIGFVSDLRVGSNADLRFTPTLVFADRLLNYDYKTEAPISKKVPTTTVEFPIGLKLKSDRRLNFRAYLLAGGKYSMDIISKKKTDDSGYNLEEKFVKNNKNFLSYEVGVGFDFYFEYFKMTPEIKLSNSIGNVLKQEDHPFSSPIDKLYTRNFVFSLYFE
jgi:hypothetical protein